MSCPCCDVFRKYRINRQFCPGCLYCGARLIQVIGKLPIAHRDIATRRRAVLKDWMQAGHLEADLRALAANTQTPIANARRSSPSLPR